MKVDYQFSDMGTAAIHAGGNPNAEHAHLAPFTPPLLLRLIALNRE